MHLKYIFVGSILTNRFEMHFKPIVFFLLGAVYCQTRNVRHIEDTAETPEPAGHRAQTSTQAFTPK